MRAKIYSTDYAQNKKLEFCGEKELVRKPADVVEDVNKKEDVEQKLINLHPEVEYHTFLGFGGAFTEAAAVALGRLSKERQDEFMDAYFSQEKGIGYTFGRTHINSCDFSVDGYTYVKEGDSTLETFDISHDREKIIPMIKEACKRAPGLKVFASPWTPPSYMKTSGDFHGGHLKRECYELWAKYIRKYLVAYRESGVPVQAVTIQNEPRHHQTWESCLYSVQEEIDFLGYLGRELEGLGVQIYCYDHCRERVFERAKAVFESENGKYCAGIANHWYSGDHFEEIAAVRYRYPDKIQVMSEGCCFDEQLGIKKDNALAFGEQYAHDICGSIKAGLNYYCDWNLALDEKNGPFHHREGKCYVDAPVYCDGKNNTLYYQTSYYYIGHYSKFIRPGAKCISVSSYTDKLDVCAFKNVDGSIVCVVLNTKDEPLKFHLRMHDNLLDFTADAHSIHTIILASEEDGKTVAV